MKELIEINQYLHDFASAMWVCGSILMWLLLREYGREGAFPDARGTVMRIAGKLRFLTIPALLVTLASGGVRAGTFAGYEHSGEVTTSAIVTLAAKHVVFAAFVAWGLWVHWRGRTDRPPKTHGR